MKRCSNGDSVIVSTPMRDANSAVSLFLVCSTHSHSSFRLASLLLYSLRVIFGRVRAMFTTYFQKFFLSLLPLFFRYNFTNNICLSSLHSYCQCPITWIAQAFSFKKNVYTIISSKMRLQLLLASLTTVAIGYFPSMLESDNVIEQVLQYSKIRDHFAFSTPAESKCRFTIYS